MPLNQLLDFNHLPQIIYKTSISIFKSLFIVNYIISLFIVIRLNMNISKLNTIIYSSLYMLNEFSFYQTQVNYSQILKMQAKILRA